MKKILVVFALMLMVFTIASCKKENKPPVIKGADDVIIGKGVEFDPMEGVTATDEEDGDLTDKITVEGEVDVDTVAEYELVYSVKDSDGAKAEVTRKVTVSDTATINAQDVTILKGTVETFDPMNPVEGLEIKAEDPIDGDITDQIEVTGADSVDTNTVGEYKVTYSVTNSRGNTTTVEITVIVDVTPPELTVQTHTQVLVNTDESSFDLLDGVSAVDYDGNDITDDIEVTESADLDFSEIGNEFTITYKVQDQYEKITIVERKIIVVDEIVAYAGGEEGKTYNLKFANNDIKYTFFAAAEKYLLETNQGGIPVFSNSGYSMFNSRVQLATAGQVYVPVMGFATRYSTMSADDSTVLMPTESYGNEGEYTFRDSLADNPTTLFHWEYDDSTSSDVITLFLDAPYRFQLNDAKDGYDLVPSMASDYPQPAGETTTIGEKTVSKVWKMPIRDGLVWTYHEDTDTSSFSDDHEKITAEDFYETYKLALENEWFRATSGGGDFLSDTQAILNAEKFIEGEADWEEVGIKLLEEENAIEFTFVNYMSEWNVRYWLGSFVMGPVNLDLYESLQDGENNSYGTTPEKTAYNGQFVLDSWEHDKLLSYSANPNYHDKDNTHLTGWTYSIIKDAEVRWQEFLKGKLDVGVVPTSQYPQFKDHPAIKEIPGATTFRLMINGLGSVDAQQEQFPGSEYEPEPILAHPAFKKAMYFAIDRYTLATEVLKTSTPQMYHFSEAYVVDAEEGTAFRHTEQAEVVGENLAPDSYGYSKDKAVEQWTIAINDLIEDGVYEPNDTIEIELRIFSGSDAQRFFGNFIKESFEETFKDVQGVKVEVTVKETDFPDIYYDYMMVGNFDLSIGGISGSTLDAASFLDVYCDDNRGGFTLNWGINTSIPEIKVTYETEVDGETTEVTEFWSYNAIVAALNGEAFIKNGVEAEKPE